MPQICKFIASVPDPPCEAAVPQTGLIDGWLHILPVTALWQH